MQLVEESLVVRVWSGGVVHKPTPGLTGTSRRTKHLRTFHHSPKDCGNASQLVETFGPLTGCFANGSSAGGCQSYSSSAQQEKRSRGPNATLRCVYNYEDKYNFRRILSGDDLLFDSHFESGNLLDAHRLAYGDIRDRDKSTQEYDLNLHHDVHSIGHTQWFYFQCTNTRAGITVKFNILNFLKPDSLFNYGMRPLIYSTEDAKNGQGWKRTGHNIIYYKGKKSKKAKKRMHTLSFTHTFEHTGDICFFACGYPYTYSFLQNHLSNCQLDPNRARVFRRTVLCRTLSGNNCDLLTITEPTSSTADLQQRRGVVITARVHPGETCASWICQGIIDFLTGPSEDARELRSRFVFKIVPMLNPDGVINGNYRTSMAGVDLNRRWDRPDPIYHPTIHYTKEMVRRLQRCREIITVCDVHGHSRKEGLFMYGCIPTPTYQMNSTTAVDDKNLGGSITALTFPEIFDRESEFFQFTGCNFKMQKNKAPTMRMVMFEELGIKCSYTLEASHSGVHGRHFSCADLQKMGTQYCASLLEFARYIDGVESTTINLHESRLCYASLVGNHGSSAVESICGVQAGGNYVPSRAVHNIPSSFPSGGMENRELNNISCQPRNQDEILYNTRQRELSLADSLNEITVPQNSVVPFKFESTEQELNQQHSQLKGLSIGSAGSDSDPSDDNMSEKEVMRLLSGAKGKRKKRKKKKNGKARQGSSSSQRSFTVVDEQKRPTNIVRDKQAGRGGNNQQQQQHFQQVRFKPLRERQSLSVVVFPSITEKMDCCNKKSPSPSSPTLKPEASNKCVTSWTMHVPDALENIMPITTSFKGGSMKTNYIDLRNTPQPKTYQSKSFSRFCSCTPLSQNFHDEKSSFSPIFK